MIALLTLLSIFIFSFIAKVDTVHSIPLCFFKHFTGLDCPGCGLTRSFIALSHGQWLEALKFNVLGPIVYLYFLLYLIRHFLNLILSKGFVISWALPRTTSLFLITILFIQWFYKLSIHII